MTISQFITLMASLGLTHNQINYLLDLENIRQANGMYPDLGTLADLIIRLARPLPPAPTYGILSIAEGEGTLIAQVGKRVVDNP